MPVYRSIQQVKLFLLVMNPMMGRAEDGEIAAISDDYDRLVSFYNASLLAEPVRTPDNYLHFFREDTPLYWFNKVNTLEPNADTFFGHGIRTTWETTEDVPNIQSRFHWI